MSGWYQVWLDDALGTRVTELSNLIGMSIVKGVQSAAWSIALPGDFDLYLIAKDQLVEIWRKPYLSLQPQLLFVGMLKTIRQEENESGIGNLIIGGTDARALLGSRIVAYQAGSAQATKTDNADDMMKAIVRENLGSTATDTTRDLTGQGITVAADISQAPSISKAFGWKNVLTVINDIAAASAQAGTDLYYDMRPTILSTGKIGFVFETAINQPGIDRTTEVYFGKTWGNLSQPVLIEDYTDEASYVYAGGRGLEISDTERMGNSVWGRKELFLDTKAETNATIMTGIANEELALRRGKKTFSARLHDTDASRFGVEWNFGDRVICQAFGQEFTGVIRTLQITVNNGGEKLEARIELDTA